MSSSRSISVPPQLTISSSSSKLFNHLCRFLACSKSAGVATRAFFTVFTLSSVIQVYSSLVRPWFGVAARSRAAWKAALTEHLNGSYSRSLQEHASPEWCRCYGCYVLPTFTTGKLSEIGCDGYSDESQSGQTRRGEGPLYSS